MILSLLTGGSQITGGQLLADAVVVLGVNQISFSLLFWELDSGGAPYGVRRPRGGRRRTSSSRKTTTRRWQRPAEADLGTTYVALTNSIAFSPTDTMPLTPRAKLYMTFESVTSAITILIVAARAVNVLQS